MAPRRRGGVPVGIVSEHLAQLLASLMFNNGGKGTRLDGNVVRVEHHRGRVAEETGHGQVCGHVALIPRIDTVSSVRSEQREEEGR